MKILIFGGSGKIGAAVAWDLAKDKDVETIGLVGRHRATLQKIKDWVGSKKIVLHTLDVNKKKEVIALMKKYDASASVLPDRKTSYKILHCSVEAGVSSVDALEEFHLTPDPYEIEGLEIPRGMTLEKYAQWLHRQALKNGVTFIDGMGFAPGISNITCGEAIRKLDVAEKAIARVGGIPSKEASFKHPLRYMITWAFWHVLREYMIKLKVIKNGKIVEVDAATDLEKFRFNQLGKDEDLECAVTPGMPSFLLTRPTLKEFAEKTVRWPGHWQGVLTLKECGLLDIKPVNFQGTKIVPRDFLSHLITPRLQPNPGETDVCVMYNTVEGMKNGKKVRVEYFLWDEADREHRISSMMRVTGFPVAIAARMLAKKMIKETGIVAPEDAFYGDVYKQFMAELEQRGIRILEVIKDI
ncbi:MAG: saccharopine dehydrogenase NADP-binding domain-containing protein [Candidatus Aminicenantes bacterium]|nr:saccharopine dehydrogenase NADP-binding domain-containing protein [Candidatus Aminicenantes bacterium]